MPLDDGRIGSRFDKQRERKQQNEAGLPGEDESALPPPVETIRGGKDDVGRNDPCPCGSGKKYKKCCGK